MHSISRKKMEHVLLGTKESMPREIMVVAGGSSVGFTKGKWWLV